MRKKQKIMTGLFLAGLVFMLTYTWFYLERQVPRQLHLVVHEQENFDLSLPFDVTLTSESEEVTLTNRSNIPSDEIRLQIDEPFSLKSDRIGSYSLGLKLFGRFTFREIRVDVVETRYAIPCGVPAGIYLKSDGVLVVGTGKLTNRDGEEVEPADGVLRSGDYIEAVNGTPLRDKEELVNCLGKNTGEEVLLRVRRGGKDLDIRMEPVQTEDGSYKLGAWVRDDTQGIGTLTYLDENGRFGALGHGISDSDTGQVVESTGGALYDTQILGINKGTAGAPGVMAGVIFYGPGTELGTVEKNTEAGIFGRAGQRLKQMVTSEPAEVSYRQDVHKGAACIRTGVSGEVKDYEIEIQRVELNPVQQNKGLILRITDPELLELTGGIIQGMSGSPILQDGKLVGAVTHVFVNDPARGYGILIEDMMEAAEIY